MNELSAPTAEGSGPGRTIARSGSSFAPGSLIWGKVKGLPWWPGQVLTYEQAQALNPRFSCTKQPGKHLISFFGDFKYNWLYPEELRDFTDYFDEHKKVSRPTKVGCCVDALPCCCWNSRCKPLCNPITTKKL